MSFDNNLANVIEHYEKLIKENNFLIKTNDSYNFSQLKWKHKNEEYKQLVKWLKQLQKIQEIIKSWEDGTIKEKDSIYAFHRICGVVEE